MLALVKDHDIVPLPGSARGLDGTPVDITRPLSFPAEALCSECGEPIRCERWLNIEPGDAGEWRHISRFTMTG